MTETATPNVEAQVEEAPAGTTEPAAETTDVQEAQPAETSDAPQEAAAETQQIEIPDDFKGEDGTPDIGKMLARIQELGAPKEGVPEAADGYELKLNEEVKLFDGQQVTLNESDPMLPEFYEWAHKNGLNQDAVQEAATLYAKGIAENLKATYTVTQDQVQSEIAKLGDGDPAKAETRVNSLLKSVGKTPAGEEGAFALLKDVRSVEAFEAVEKLMSAINGQGGGRAPALNGAIVERPPLHQRLFGKVS